MEKSSKKGKKSKKKVAEVEEIGEVVAPDDLMMDNVVSYCHLCHSPLYVALLVYTSCLHFLFTLLVYTSCLHFLFTLPVSMSLLFLHFCRAYLV